MKEILNADAKPIQLLDAYESRHRRCLEIELMIKHEVAMLPTEFIKTIYLGDRAIKKICIDGWQKSVSIEVDEISRIRSPDGLWNFYKDEDIENGEIVTMGVREFSIEPSGAIPNDYITSIACKMVDDSTFNLVIEAASVTSDGESRLATVSIVASGLHLIDPKYPDRPIRS